jgi:hypothetical protein
MDIRHKQYPVHPYSDLPYYTKFLNVLYQYNVALKGQSHEKVAEMSVWGISLGPN